LQLPQRASIPENSDAKTLVAGKLAGIFFVPSQESQSYAQIPQFFLWSRELAGNLQGISKFEPKLLNFNGLDQGTTMMLTGAGN
jgi:hypothetical protein